MPGSRFYPLAGKWNAPIDTLANGDTIAVLGRGADAGSPSKPSLPMSITCSAPNSTFASSKYEAAFSDIIADLDGQYSKRLLMRTAPNSGHHEIC